MRKYLKLEELEALFKAARTLRDRVIVRLMYETGMRVGEVAALRIGDIDFDLEEISIQHAKRHEEGRKVPLVGLRTQAMLSEYLGPRVNTKEDPVFISRRRGALTTEGIADMIRDCGMRAGLDPDKCHPHALRHTHAVHALKAGISLRALQQNLGHAKIKTTAIYLTMDIEDRKEVYASHPLPSFEKIPVDDPLLLRDWEREA